MGVISVIWVFFGFSLAFGTDLGHFVGDPFTYFMFQNVGCEVQDELTLALGLTIPLALYALFQMKFAIISPSLITGSFAERVRFSSYLIFHHSVPHCAHSLPYICVTTNKTSLSSPPSCSLSLSLFFSIPFAPSPPALEAECTFSATIVATFSFIIGPFGCCAVTQLHLKAFYSHVH